MKKILSPSDIVALEQNTLKVRPELKLMEEAGKQAFLFFSSRIKEISKERFLICCGPGNNGGDGMVLGRHLFNAGAQVRVIVFSPERKLITREIQEQINLLAQTGITPEWISSSKDFESLKSHSFKKTSWVIDAVFGIGLNRPLTGIYLEYVEWLNEVYVHRRVPICSIDIPSGIHAETGKGQGGFVLADLTLSFQHYKYGFFQADGLAACGKIIVLPIGLAWEDQLIQHSILKPLDLENVPSLPRILPNFHKRNRGHGLIIAGSREKSGASILASLACARSGVGMCTLATASVAHDLIKSQLINVMSESIPSSLDGVFESQSLSLLPQLLQGKSAVLMGPGLSPDSNRRLWVDSIVKQSIPLVLDAQALNDLSPMGDHSFEGGQVVMTPHPGEMARLTGIGITEIQDRRFEVARTYAKKWKAVVILKGVHSVIGFPNGEIWVNQVDHPCLSVAGSGDVLAGILVGLLAQGITLETAALQAVFIHGRAGEKIGDRWGVRGVLATDLLQEIPGVLHEIDTNSSS